MSAEYTQIHDNIFIALREAHNLFGRNYIICEDITNKKLSYYQLITKSIAFSHIISKKIPSKGHVGIMLPNTNINIIAIFAFARLEKAPALINYTTGPKNIISCCKTCLISTIITSKKFIAKAKLSGIIKHLKDHSIEFIYLEDLDVPIKTKIISALWPCMPKKALYRHIVSSNAPAVIVFTSGSDSTPKGVVLSHKNIQANCNQIMSSMSMGGKNILFNPLPSFHAFGLTVGTIMPIINGIKVFSYPNALHYKIIPEMIYKTRATILISTNTFLNGYHKFAHLYSFSSLKYIFSGAEKLSSKTKHAWSQEYGCNILEGYGASEASPVIAINTPTQQKEGTVGKILPGISYKLTAHDYKYTNSGKLWIKGDNVMLGYIKENNPGVIELLKDSWYDTGDIVTFDDEGFITIIDRAKRFAKIAGEMISLSSVESMLNNVWENFDSAAIRVSCEKKGEKIICITTNKQAVRKDLIDHCNKQGITRMNIPAKIVIVSDIPKLATGKIDYPQIEQNLS